MSKLTDTQIHRVELLLTLSYLMKFSDAKHPVSQLDICRYATNFGLKFDEENLAGNDIRRQRIKDVLLFLEDLSRRYKDEFTFNVKSTKTGKYYLDGRYNLSKGDIFNIVLSIENNRFIKEEVSKDLKEKIVNILSSKYEKTELEKTLSLIVSPKNRYSTYTSNTLAKLMNAIKKERIVKLKRLSYEYDDKLNDYTLKSFEKRFRVYTIKEYNGKLYALMIAIADGEIICEDIQTINIIGQEKLTFAEDLVENRDLNKLFIENNIDNKSLKTYIEEAKIPLNKKVKDFSFSFKSIYLRLIETSFRAFFSTDLPFEICKEFKRQNTDKGVTLINLNKELSKELKEKYHSKKQIDDDSLSVIVNLTINEEALIRWALSNPLFCNVIEFYDAEINRTLAKYFKRLLDKYQKYI